MFYSLNRTWFYYVCIKARQITAKESAEQSFATCVKINTSFYWN